MRSIFRLLIIFALLVFVACEVERPKNVLPPEKMEAFLYDYHLVQSMSGEYSASQNKEKLFYDYIFRKHDITKEQFDTAMLWYNRFPKHLQRIYARLEEKLDKELLLLDNARGALNDGVAIDVAYLLTDTAELWTSSRVRMLSPTMLCNRIQFSFETPSDSTFVPGDSLQFSFNARFVTKSNVDVGQRAYASVLLSYADGSFDAAGVDVSGDGNYILAVERNLESRLKAMSGFVYYTDNDSTMDSKVVIGNLSLKRMHIREPESEPKK
jgi:hypothetical protein